MKRTLQLFKPFFCIILCMHTCAWCQIQPADSLAMDEDTIAVQPIKKKQPHHIAVGIEAGIGNSYLLTGGVFNNPMLYLRAATFVYLPIRGAFCVRTGAYYTSGGGSSVTAGVSGYPGTIVAGGGYSPSFHEYRVSSTVHIQTIEVPVDIGFRYGHKTKKYKNFIGIGPYIGYVVGGSHTNTTDTSGNYAYTGPLKIGNSVSDDIRRFDYGLAFTLGTEWRSGVLLRVRAQYGLADLSPQTDSHTMLSTFSYGFQLGYIFGRKDKRIMWHANDGYLEPKM